MAGGGDPSSAVLVQRRARQRRRRPGPDPGHGRRAGWTWSSQATTTSVTNGSCPSGDHPSSCRAGPGGPDEASACPAGTLPPRARPGSPLPLRPPPSGPLAIRAISVPGSDVVDGVVSPERVVGKGRQDADSGRAGRAARVHRQHLPDPRWPKGFPSDRSGSSLRRRHTTGLRWDLSHGGTRRPPRPSPPREMRLTSRPSGPRPSAATWPRRADLVVTMTEEQRGEVLEQVPEAGPCTFTLKEPGQALLHEPRGPRRRPDADTVLERVARADALRRSPEAPPGLGPTCRSPSASPWRHGYRATAWEVETLVDEPPRGPRRVATRGPARRGHRGLMRIAIGADHAGFGAEGGPQGLPGGAGAPRSTTREASPSSRPTTHRPAVARAVRDGRAERGIVLGGSGQGGADHSQQGSRDPGCPVP